MHIVSPGPKATSRAAPPLMPSAGSRLIFTDHSSGTFIETSAQGTSTSTSASQRSGTGSGVGWKRTMAAAGESVASASAVAKRRGQQRSKRPVARLAVHGRPPFSPADMTRV